jgi:lipoate-protein ligase A
MIVDDGARGGVLNMAIDDLLARSDFFCKNEAIFRTYKWDKPTLSYGFHQKIESRIDLAECYEYGVELAQRPTGGRELLHDNDLSFSVVKRIESVNSDTINMAKDFFLKVGSFIVEALQFLGVEAEVRSGKVKRTDSRSVPCLAVTSQYEIVSGGKKIVPIAQRVYPQAVLLHGSIPLQDSVIPTALLLKSSNKNRLQEIIDGASTNLSRILGCKVNLDLLKNSLRQAFEREFDGKGIIREWPVEFLNEANKNTKTWKNIN